MSPGCARSPVPCHTSALLPQSVLPTPGREPSLIAGRVNQRSSHLAGADWNDSMADVNDELTAIAAEAYEFLYPLVTMEFTRRQATNIEAGKLPGRGPMNDFQHIREFPDADFKIVVRPNFDTLYSSAWLDLTSEPLVVSAPDTDDRYYMLPMMDMWTDVFAVPGKRTSGTGPAQWALTAPGWQGELPEDVPSIGAPTPYIWIIGRTQTNGPSDYPAVHEVQNGFTITPLSQWGKEPSGPPPLTPADTIDMTTPPLDQVNALSGRQFFALAAELLKLHPPHLTDWSTIERMSHLGLVVGQSFDADAYGPEVVEAVSAAPAEAQRHLLSSLPTLAVVVNGWQMNTNSMGVYGTFYAKRAIVTMVGLGANPAEDAIYPLLMADGDGNKVVGESEYVLHFDADDLPPVDAFWSVTMYDDQGFQAGNELDRFAIGDRDQLAYNADGSLDLYIQHGNPGSEREANWLPAPTGPLGITMRLYAPRQGVLTGGWAPPPLRKVT
jgi:hypothetical protein